MDEKITESVEAAGGQMTRSIRGSKQDFDTLKRVAKELGMSQGAAFSQLLASWELHHASSEMQEQAANVKAAQSLLAQLEHLIVGQYSAMDALEAEAKKAASAEMESLRRQLSAAREDEAAARADVEAAQTAMSEAKAAQKAAERTAHDAVTAQVAAEDARAKAEAKQTAAERTVSALQTAAEDARAERNTVKDELTRLYGELQKLRERADGYDRATAALADARAKISDLKADLIAEKADRRKVAADLMDLMKSVDGRVEAAKAEAVKVAKAEVKVEYDKRYAAAVAKAEADAQARAEKAIAAAKEQH